MDCFRGQTGTRGLSDERFRKRVYCQVGTWKSFILIVKAANMGEFPLIFPHSTLQGLYFEAGCVSVPWG